MTTSKPQNLLKRLSRVIIFLVLAVTVVVFIVAHVLAWRWASKPFLGMMLEPTLLISPMESKHWARLQPDSSLQEHLHLISIDGRSVKRQADVAAILSEYKVGDTVQVTVADRDGQQREVQLPLTSFPLRDMILFFLLPYLAGLAYLGIGIWVYWVQGWGRAGQVFVGLCVSMAMTIGLLFELNTTHLTAVLWCMAVPFAAAFAMHLALVFPQEPRFVKRAPALCILPYLPATFLAVRASLSVYDISQPWQYIDRWFNSYVFVIVGIFFLLAMLTYRLIRPPSPLARQQSRIILLGTTLAFLPVVPWLVLVVVGQIVPFVTHVYALLFVLFPLSIAYAILRYRLLDVDRLLSRGVAYGTLTFLTIATYFLVINGLSQLFAIRANDPVVLSIFVLTLTLVFNPLRNWIQRLVDRVFFRQTVDYHAALQDFSHELTHTLDLNAVLAEVGKRIEEALRPSRQWVCLYDEDISCYVGQPMGEKQAAAFPVTFMPDGTLARWLRDHQECLYLPPEKGLPSELADEWVQMGAIGAVAYVPLQSQERLIGWLAVGPKRSGHPYHSDDLAFLRALADQSALAVENARLFTSVRRNLAAISEMKNLMDDVFSSIASGVITTDIRDKVTLFNRAAEAIVGIKADEVVGRSCGQALACLGDDLESLLRQVKFSETPVMAYEAQPELPSRGPVWLRMNLSPLKDSRDVTNGVAIVMDDLTLQRELEAKAQRIQETFQRYVAPAVVRRLISNPELVELGGMRREITSFYADIRGFTSFSEKTEPEFQIEVLNKHLTLAAGAILEQEGTLDKFVGDAVMAVFNTPEPQEDHTLRAVRAALAMQKAIQDGHQRMDEKERLHFGVGITVGEAVVGNIGSAVVQNFTAIGDSVNFSSRLSDIAGPGQIFVSAEAYERVKDHVEARLVGDVQVKGHSSTDKVYEILGLKPDTAE
ncbi:MAG: PAS domain S-box protein [Anaerolineae bacterium]|nr:PAS domain S-box protein [Anaerolineae bacterium]